MKQSTIKKYIDILTEAKQNCKSLKQFCKENDIDYNNIVSNIYNLKKQSKKDENIEYLLNLYNENVLNKSENKCEVNIIRDSNTIIKYDIIVYKRDKINFRCTLSREDCETIFGLYTYYGGNITARNVANEFPRFTLPEVKLIFRAFNLTKDSFWAPPHLLEELSTEELSNYRMNLKERAAFKYADASQERDFKNTLNKFAKKINKLSDRNQVLEELCTKDIILPEYKVNTNFSKNSKTFILCLSDLHVGGFNEKYGYVKLEDYNEEEILRRLSKVFNYLNNRKYDNIVVVNLGDSIDSYNKQTTRGGHDLPGYISNKEQSQMYLKLMLWFFNNLKSYCSNIKYYCTGESNHK